VKYLVIDTDGHLYQRTAPRYDVALRDVGPEGWARVRLHTAAEVAGPEHVHLAGFVNDCGLLFPEKYPRNVVGSCLLASVGASPQPYAGPVLLTGWQEDPYGDEPEVRSLTPDQARHARRMHTDLRRVLGLDAGTPSGDAAPRWCRAMRQLAEEVRSGPTPEIRFVTDPAEVLAWLRGTR
jgi:hypothetical protein